MAETEIDRLRAELRQSSDREADARAKGHQVVKTLEGKLQTEVAVRSRTKEEYEKLREEANKKDAAITGLWELAEKKKAWYDKQLVHERAQMHEVQVRLNNEMGRLKELHLKESQLWAKMKSLYEEVVVANKRKIENLTKALDESQVHATLMTDRIRTILQANHEKFNMKLKAAMDKGWARWATQAIELHIYCADRENRRKDGKGFYKLSEDNIAVVREDLVEDYQALANQHSEELTQLMEEFTES